jgi:hypothetical protein
MTKEELKKKIKEFLDEEEKESQRTGFYDYDDDTIEGYSYHLLREALRHL